MLVHCGGDGLTIYRTAITTTPDEGEEDAVVDWCGRMSDLYFPVTLALAFYELVVRPKLPHQLGTLASSLENIRSKVTTTIEEQRKWYRTLRSLMQQHHIISENLWNCDEKGIIIMGLAVGR